MLFIFLVCCLTEYLYTYILSQQVSDFNLHEASDNNILHMNTDTISTVPCKLIHDKNIV